MDKLDLQQRTKALALRVFKLLDSLPRTISGRICSNQLGRCASSVAANYRAACRARSKAEFIAKLGIVEEEADETAFWLEMIVEAGLMKSSRVLRLLTEASELTAIMASSRITAGKNIRKSAIENRK